MAAASVAVVSQRRHHCSCVRTSARPSTARTSFRNVTKQNFFSAFIQTLSTGVVPGVPEVLSSGKAAHEAAEQAAQEAQEAQAAEEKAAKEKQAAREAELAVAKEAKEAGAATEQAAKEAGELASKEAAEAAAAAAHQAAHEAALAAALAAAKEEERAAAEQAAKEPEPGPTFTLQELQQREGVPALVYPDGVDAANRETYLANAEFEALFKMDKAAFAQLPGWKRTAAKKELKLH